VDEIDLDDELEMDQDDFCDFLDEIGYGQDDEVDEDEDWTEGFQPWDGDHNSSAW